MKIVKLLSVLLSLAILAGMLSVMTVLPSAATETEGMTFTDQGIYKTEKALEAMPQVFEAEINIPAGNSVRGTVLSNAASGAYITYDISESGNPRVIVRDASANSDTITFDQVDVRTDAWVKLAIVRDATGAAWHCYVDGALKQSVAMTNVTGEAVGAGVFYFGNDSTQGYPNYFRGSIRSAALYGAVELAEDLSAYTPSAALLSYAPTGAFGEAAKVADASGNGYDAVWERLWFDEVEPVTDYAYSFAVVGDIQNITRRNPGNVGLIYDYIVDNAKSQNIKFAINLGDITDGNSDTEWVNATAAIKKLNGVVPYSLIRGNEPHDSEAQFDKYITMEDFGGSATGTMVEGSLLNAYYEFSVGDTDYLILTVDCTASPEELAWACSVLEKEEYKYHNVIVTTHAYLTGNGTTIDPGDDMTILNSNKSDGYSIWSKLVSKYANVKMVLCGHVDNEDIVVSKAQGANGNTVTQVLIDPQTLDTNLRSTGGVGMVAMLYFSEDGKNIDVRYYSTVRKQYWKANNQFSFDVETAWDETIPALNAAEDTEKETFSFTPAGLSPYSGGKYTATVTESSTGTNYYSFPATETEIVDALEAKFDFYYDREGVHYKERDLFTNGDSDGNTRWLLLWNEYLQRNCNKSSGEIFRKIDALVPKNSFGQQIVAKNFETTFHARLENETVGAVILGFRQQIPGKFTWGYYKQDREQGLIAIGRKGISIVGGGDIIVGKGNAGNPYNTWLTDTFDDETTTDTTEMLPKSISVKVRAVGKTVSVYIYDTYNDATLSSPLYSYENVEMPYDSAGYISYAVSAVGNSIGAVKLTVLDDEGNVADAAVTTEKEDPATLRFKGGDIHVDAEKTANGYTYVMTADAVDGYRLDGDTLYVEDASGNKVIPTRNGAEYTVELASAGTVYATFVSRGVVPTLDAAQPEVETFDFTVKDLGPYNTATGKYAWADGTNRDYYTIQTTDTDIVAGLQEKFSFYYNRESVVYGERDFFANGDTETTSWMFYENNWFQRTSSKTSGEIMRATDSLVPKNSLGENIVLKNFETTFDIRFESTTGGILLGFRQQQPGRFVSGYYKPVQKQGFVIIGRSGINIAAGTDIKTGGKTVAGNMYNAWLTDTFDDADTTDTTETLPQEVTVKVRVVDTTCEVWIYEYHTTTVLKQYKQDVPYTTAGTIAYGISPLKHNIGNIELTKLDEDGHATDMLTDVSEDDNALTYRNGTVEVVASEATETGYKYTVSATPDEGYELKAGSLYFVGEDGTTVVPQRVGYREGGDASQYVFETTDGGTVYAEFYQPTDSEPNIGAVGTQVHETDEALRFIHRMNLKEKDGKRWLTLDGVDYEVADYGLLLASSKQVPVPADLKVETAAANPYVKKYSAPERNRYYDLCTDYVDVAVHVKGIVSGGGINDKLVTRAYVTLANGTVYYGSAFTESYAGATAE